METDFFEIYGTRIPYSDIKDFRIVQKEYIYRPTYIGSKNLFGKTKYEFFAMQPYAAIADQYDRKSALSNYNTKGSFKESVGKDIIEAAMTTIGDKFNIKALRSTKFECINQTGRRFATYLEDIPALVMDQNGQASDVYKNDELYKSLDSRIAPVINIVHALIIRAKETYVFYGNSIQVNDIGAEYERLKHEIAAYKEARHQYSLGNRIRLSLPFSKRQSPSSQNTEKLPEHIRD